MRCEKDLVNVWPFFSYQHQLRINLIGIKILGLMCGK